MNNEINLLDILSDLYATSVDFKFYLEQATEEELKLMVINLTDKVIGLNDFIFENIDLQDFDTKS